MTDWVVDAREIVKIYKMGEIEVAALRGALQDRIRMPHRVSHALGVVPQQQGAVPSLGQIGPPKGWRGQKAASEDQIPSPADAPERWREPLQGL